jgi:hypothetical protein
MHYSFTVCNLVYNCFYADFAFPSHLNTALN